MWIRELSRRTWSILEQLQLLPGLQTSQVRERSKAHDHELPLRTADVSGQREV